LKFILVGMSARTSRQRSQLIKMKSLFHAFKFLRKYLTTDLFLKAASGHFYGTVFYASSVVHVVGFDLLCRS